MWNWPNHPKFVTPIFKSRVMTQYVSVAHIHRDVLFFMLHHASKFEIAIISHTSLAEDIREGS